MTILAGLLLSVSAFAGGGGMDDGYDGEYTNDYSQVAIGKCTGKNTVIFSQGVEQGEAVYMITVIANKTKHVFYNRTGSYPGGKDGREIFINKNYLEGSKVTDYLIGFQRPSQYGYTEDNAYITTDIQFDGSAGRFMAYKFDEHAPKYRGKQFIDIEVENCFH